MSRFYCFISAASLLVLLSACKKKDTVTDPPASNEPTPAANAKVIVSMNYTFGNDNFALQQWYKTENGDSLRIRKFVYYLSNIVLVKADGTRYTEPNSYHLLTFSNTSTPSFTLSDVPEGEYTKLEALIGVDSLRNCSGSQTGDLDQAKGMFWTWNSGYIFSKLEGTSPKSPGNFDVTYHIGGFKGVNKTQRSISLPIGATALKASVTSAAQLLLKTDVAEVFKNPAKINVANTYYVMNEGAAAASIADNYKDMISVKGVVNP